MSEALMRLAIEAGVVDSYIDTTGMRHETHPESARQCLTAMGFAVASDPEIAESLDNLYSAQESRWLARWVSVESDSNATISVPDNVEWQLVFEDGGVSSGRGTVNVEHWPLGLHHLQAGEDRCAVISAPGTLPLPERGWGVNLPLPGLWREGEAAIGSYADLECAALALAENGARFAGCNPIHAGFPTDASAFSPYSPSHRRRINVLHIAADGLEMPFPSDQGSSLIDYERLIPQKLKELRKKFERFETAGESESFLDYVAQEGIALEEFAIHQALSERLGPYWSNWPLAEQFPSPQVMETAKHELSHEIRFYAWLQFEAERQLQQAHDKLSEKGMRHGLYLDLAVGTHPHGAETWGDRHLFGQGISLGAPPDPLGPDGQRWGLSPFNPRALIQDGFRSFAETLRRQLRFAGLLRIDHILGFERAFWVPDDPSLPGTYVTMPVEALLAVARLEAARAGAIIIGEDLGNIPPGLQAKLSHSGILGCRLAMFEQEFDGSFKEPGAFDEATIASFSTHDLPTWRGWRAGLDIKTRASLSASDNAGLAESMKERSATVRRLETAIGASDDNPEPMHCYLAKTASRLAMVQVEDILDMERQANLPGTIHEYPNWRQRLAVPVTELKSDPRLTKTADIMKEEGR